MLNNNYVINGFTLIFLLLTISCEIAKTNQCISRCSCWNQNSTENCPISKIKYLNIELDHRRILISCKDSENFNFEDVQSFDGKYLDYINDSTSLNLFSMIERCSQTRAKQIIYQLDSKKFRGLNASENILRNVNSLKFFNFKKNVNDKNLTVSLLQNNFLSYGSNLYSVTMNNLLLPDLNNYFENMSHIEILNLASNNIKNVLEKTFKNLTKLKQLNLQGNEISNIDEQTFNHLENLIDLDLSNNKIISLYGKLFSEIHNLKSLNLSKNLLNDIEKNTFKNLTKLKKLDLSENIKLNIGENLFESLSSLNSLNLSECNVKNVTDKLFNNLKSLEALNLSRNGIEQLTPNSFENLKKLRYLDLSFNNLTFLHNGTIDSLTNLQKLYLTSNKLKVFNSELFLSNHKLETIEMSFNLINKFQNTNSKFTVKEIILKNNKIKRFPDFSLQQVIELKYLDLTYNEITTVELIKDSVLLNANIEIDLSHNQITDFKTIPLKIEDNKTDTNNNNWNILVDFSYNLIKCNCLNYQVQEEQEIQNGETVFEINKTNDLCYTRYPYDSCPMIAIKNCPINSCNCYYNRILNAIIVDCSYRNLTEFPEIIGLETNKYEHNQTIIRLNNNLLNSEYQEKLDKYSNVSLLDLSFNSIKILNYLPAKFIDLKLDNNELVGLSENIINKLKNNTSFHYVSLFNNSWKCVCEDASLKQFLIQYNNVKLNQFDVFCQNSGKELIYTRICDNQNILKVALPVTLTAFVALISVLLALYFKYNTSIKVYLYSKNLCLWFVAEDELDKDKTYDIFISYSQKDADFVQNELITELEEGEPKFKICIHHRDWMPGEFISTQIVSSVLDSRRTLVVLSNNFMESVWGKMEFRTAHLQAINEGRARVIVVLYGDLDESTLDEEMKTYLKTNTYVQWGDPWFWSKLKYALPHSKLKRKRRKRIENSQETFNLQV